MDGGRKGQLGGLMDMEVPYFFMRVDCVAFERTERFASGRAEVGSDLVPVDVEGAAKASSVVLGFFL